LRSGLVGQRTAVGNQIRGFFLSAASPCAKELETETPPAASEATAAQAEAGTTLEQPSSPQLPKSARRALPAHLPARDVVHAPSCACPVCGREMRKVSEDVTEILDYIPGHFEVVRHVRPAFSCRRCESMAQSHMPSLPIERGQAGAGLLAHILVSKYCDHVRSTTSPAFTRAKAWSSTAPRWRPGSAKSRRSPRPWSKRLPAEKLHVDDAPVPVWAPGMGKTKRLWVYLRDERPFGGRAPPAVVYRYSPDRKAEHPRAQLAHFDGFLQADGYSGFGPLYQAADRQPPSVTEVTCWAHVRRYFYDIHVTTNAPIAGEALQRIGNLYVERTAIKLSPEQRQRIRQSVARPLIDDLATFLDASLAMISGRSELAKAIRYARSRWAALTRYLDDGTLEISNNAAERAIRPLALGRKNYLFAGSDAGGERAAAAYTLIETAKLNSPDPQAYLREVIDRIADHPINRVAELLPWNIGLASPIRAAA